MLLTWFCSMLAGGAIFSLLLLWLLWGVETKLSVLIIEFTAAAVASHPEGWGLFPPEWGGDSGKEDIGKFILTFKNPFPRDSIISVNVSEGQTTVNNLVSGLASIELYNLRYSFQSRWFDRIKMFANERIHSIIGFGESAEYKGHRELSLILLINTVQMMLWSKVFASIFLDLSRWFRILDCKQVVPGDAIQ